MKVKLVKKAMDLKNKMMIARKLIDMHYAIHCEQINNNSSDNNFDLTYFINFYRIEMMKQIKAIFEMTDEQFEKLKEHSIFVSSIIKYIDSIVIKLANMALNQRLYPTSTKSRRKL